MKEIKVTGYESRVTPTGLQDTEITVQADEHITATVKITTGSISFYDVTVFADDKKVAAIYADADKVIYEAKKVTESKRAVWTKEGGHHDYTFTREVIKEYKTLKGFNAALSVYGLTYEGIIEISNTAIDAMIKICDEENVIDQICTADAVETSVEVMETAINAESSSEVENADINEANGEYEETSIKVIGNLVRQAVKFDEVKLDLSKGVVANTTCKDEKTVSAVKEIIRKAHLLEFGKISTADLLKNGKDYFDCYFYESCDFNDFFNLGVTLNGLEKICKVYGIENFTVDYLASKHKLQVLSNVTNTLKRGFENLATATVNDTTFNLTVNDAPALDSVTYTVSAENTLEKTSINVDTTAKIEPLKKVKKFEVGKIYTVSNGTRYKVVGFETRTTTFGNKEHFVMLKRGDNAPFLAAMNTYPSSNPKKYDKEEVAIVFRNDTEPFDQTYLTLNARNVVEGTSNDEETALPDDSDDAQADTIISDISDIDAQISALTELRKKKADSLQKLMSKTCTWAYEKLKAFIKTHGEFMMILLNSAGTRRRITDLDADEIYFDGNINDNKISFTVSKHLTHLATYNSVMDFKAAVTDFINALERGDNEYKF